MKFSFLFLFLISFVLRFFNLWLQAYLTGANVGFTELIGMFFRKADGKPHHFGLITRAKIMAVAMHPYLSGVPHRIGYVQKMFEEILSKPGVAWPM